MALENLKLLPIFRGTSGEVEDWVYKARLCMELLDPKIDHAGRITMLKTRFEDMAVVWAQTTDFRDIKTADKFLDLILATFITEDDKQRASDEFFALRQGNKTVWEFATDLRRKAMRVEGITDKVALGIFVKGLKPEIYTLIRFMDYVDMSLLC